MRYPHYLSGLVIVLAAALPLKANASTIIYQSIPDLSARPSLNAWCSGCDGFGEYIDAFTLSNSYVIDQVNFVTGPTEEYSGYGARVRIWSDDRSQILFNHTFLNPLIIGQTGTPENGTFILAGLVPDFLLTPGNYWISFWGPTLGIPGFQGGNGLGGNLWVPGCGTCGFGPTEDNSGYALLGEPAVVPIPAALPLFAGGLGLLGWLARRRQKQL